MSDAPEDGSKPTSIWARINKPLSDRGANIAGASGLILFGLSGLLDVLEGRSFGIVKSVALVAGAGAAILLWRNASRNGDGGG
jgi:hypothetical protein